MRRVNILVDRVFNLMQKGMDHAAIDKNELQDEVDANERNVADAKNTLDPAKVDESNAPGLVVSTHGGRNIKKTLVMLINIM